MSPVLHVVRATFPLFQPVESVGYLFGMCTPGGYFGSYHVFYIDPFVIEFITQLTSKGTFIRALAVLFSQPNGVGYRNVGVVDAVAAVLTFLIIEGIEADGRVGCEGMEVIDAAEIGMIVQVILRRKRWTTQGRRREEGTGQGIVSIKPCIIAHALCQSAQRSPTVVECTRSKELIFLSNLDCRQITVPTKRRTADTD